jgi:hypothetical protein
MGDSTDSATRELAADLERRLSAIDTEQAFDAQKLHEDLVAARRLLATLSDRLGTGPAARAQRAGISASYEGHDVHVQHGDAPRVPR